MATKITYIEKIASHINAIDTNADGTKDVDSVIRLLIMAGSGLGTIETNTISGDGAPYQIMEKVTHMRAHPDNKLGMIFTGEGCELHAFLPVDLEDPTKKAVCIDGRYPNEEEKKADIERAKRMFGKQPKAGKPAPIKGLSQTGRIIQAIVTGWIEETITGDDEHVNARLQAIYDLKANTLTTMGIGWEKKRVTHKPRWYGDKGESYTMDIFKGTTPDEYKISVTVTEIAAPMVPRTVSPATHSKYYSPIYKKWKR